MPDRPFLLRLDWRCRKQQHNNGYGAGKRCISRIASRGARSDCQCFPSGAPAYSRRTRGYGDCRKCPRRDSQIAVFDTGFHRQMPESSAIYPGPYEWAEKGIRRYGFHGINHQYCAGRAAQLLRKDATSLKLVSCHLGNGCSVTAIQGGRSVDTTMGFTPLEGLMMGTRSARSIPAFSLS